LLLLVVGGAVVVPMILQPGVKRPKREDGNSLPRCVDVKNACRFKPIPQEAHSFMTWCLGTGATLPLPFMEDIKIATTQTFEVSFSNSTGAN
jgi:hypothetical protein